MRHQVKALCAACHRRFWLYAAVVLLYGIVETLNGNWSTLYLTQQRGVPIQWASLALTAFWAMVTVGRVLAAVISSRVPARWIYLGLPMLLVVAFLVVSQVSTAIGGVLAFGLAGLACSAFFPLSISFGGEEFPRLTAVDLRRIDRLLPGRLWDRRLWDRMAPGGNPYSLVDYLRGSQSCRWCDDRACIPGDQAADHESCKNERRILKKEKRCDSRSRLQNSKAAYLRSYPTNFRTFGVRTAIYAVLTML